MAENTKIEWADHTFNPWIGCTKVSPACDHCYAEKERASTALGVKWGAHMPRHRTGESNWKTPERWNAEAERRGVRESVFCASLGDWADNAVPGQWRLDLAGVIRKTSWLYWLLLTKRIGNAAAMLAEMFPEGVPDNVWIGATICNQEEADRDIPKLLAVPAAKRFLSMEPLLGEVDITTHLWGRPKPCSDCPEDADCVCGYARRGTVFGDPALHWVIVGGESGPNARPMRPDWARSLRNQCQDAGVPFLFKQWGEWADMQSAQIASGGPATDRNGDVTNWMRQRVTFSDSADREVEAHSWTGHATDLVYRVGKKAAGRLLDGRTWDEVPS